MYRAQSHTEAHRISMALCDLAATLGCGVPAIFSDGTQMTKQQLYKRAITFSPTNGRAYYSLGKSLPYGKTTTLEDGTIMTKEELFAVKGARACPQPAAGRSPSPVPRRA